MSVILNTDFSTISDHIAQARISQLESSAQIYDGVVVIVNLQETYLSAEIDLLDKFWKSYLESVQSTQVASNLLSDISVLHQHVISRATNGAGDLYDDINDWLRDESIQVFETYADLSEEAGWTIDLDRIKTDPTLYFITSSSSSMSSSSSSSRSSSSSSSSSSSKSSSSSSSESSSSSSKSSISSSISSSRSSSRSSSSSSSSSLSSSSRSSRSSSDSSNSSSSESSLSSTSSSSTSSSSSSTSSSSSSRSSSSSSSYTPA